MARSAAGARRSRRVDRSRTGRIRIARVASSTPRSTRRSCCAGCRHGHHDRREHYGQRHVYAPRSGDGTLAHGAAHWLPRADDADRPARPSTRSTCSRTSCGSRRRSSRASRRRCRRRTRPTPSRRQSHPDQRDAGADDRERDPGPDPGAAIEHNNGGAPGGGMQIQIRGITSINANASRCTSSTA